MAALGVRTVSYNGGDAGAGIATGILVPADTPVQEYIELGWVPNRIEILNLTGTTTATTAITIWQKGLASTNAMQIAGVSGIVTKGVTGPYPYAGGQVTVDTVVNTVTKAGFYIPTGLQTNASDVISWIAYR